MNVLGYATVFFTVCANIASPSRNSEKACPSLQRPPSQLDRTGYLENCGVDIAYFCARYFGRTATLDDIVGCIGPDQIEKGIHIEQLQQALHELSLHSKVVQGTPGRIMEMIDQTDVLIVPNVEAKHLYAYVLGDGNGLYVYNPPYGSGWVDMGRFEQDWDGAGVLVSDGPKAFKEMDWRSSVAVLPWVRWLLGAIGGAGVVSGLWLRRKRLLRRVSSA